MTRPDFTEAERRVAAAIGAALSLSDMDPARAAALCLSAASHCAVAAGLDLPLMVDQLGVVYRSAAASKAQSRSEAPS